MTAGLSMPDIKSENGSIGGEKGVLKINSERKHCHFYFQHVTEFGTWWQSIIKWPWNLLEIGGSDWDHRFFMLHIYFWTHLSMMCQKMALRCQTEVAVSSASIYPRDCSVIISPVKYSFDSHHWSLASQNRGRSSCCWTTFVFNSSLRDAACMLQNKVKHGAKAKMGIFHQLCVCNLLLSCLHHECLFMLP